MASQSNYSPHSIKHVAIIMDGNRRWSENNGLPQLSGHKKGADVVKDIVRASKDQGLDYLTLFAFSSENWKRSPLWIKEFMGMLRYYLENEFKSLIKEKIRIKFIGDLSALSHDIQKLAHKYEEETKNFEGIQVNIALSYGGRDDIVRAFQKIAEKVSSQKLTLQEINESLISENLDTRGIPDPDLLIRTSGEERLSNFLLWQMAYTEFVFTKTLWPDYTVGEFISTIENMRHRERRFGSYCATTEK